MVPLAIPEQVPLLYLTNQVLLPGGFLKIRIEGEQNKTLMKSQLQILNNEEKNKAIVGVIPQAEDEQTFNEDTVGTVALVFQVMSTSWPKPCYTAIVFGLYRFKLQKIVELEPYPVAVIALHYDNYKGNEEVELLLDDLKKACSPLWQSIDLFFPSSKKFKKVLPPTYVVDVCASFVASAFAEKLDILQTLDFTERLKKTSALVAKHIEGLDTEPGPFSKSSITGVKPIRIASVRIKRGLSPRSYYPADSEEVDDIEELLKKLKSSNLPDYALKITMQELRRLKRISTYSPEHGVIRNYLELIADLPWSVSSNEILDIRKAKKDLDVDHYAMDKLKKRVLEFLAVRQLKNNLRGPILCFVGAPGVGKTSIGKSIAKTLGRAFHRISLGGVNNQSDIRGHRRTYVGALPGRIIQGLHSAGTKNPVMLLDEIDKMSVSHNGDPAAALLEVLDPEQNSHFTDHYLNMPFDLSQVMFIATANRIATIPPALLDRMEVIHVPGYTEEEKFHIVEKHLLPKQLNQHGLNDSYINVTDESMKHLINGYTKEAGVRALERKLAAVCRAVAVQVAEGDICDGDSTILPSKPNLPITITSESLHDILGPPMYDGDSLWCRVGVPGVAVGLACNSSGGSVMLVEASKLKGGSGELVLTGHLGTVMKESAKLALNWVRSVAIQYGLQTGGVDLMTDTDVHIHFPAGAIGKEGPSAGVTIATALISLFTGIPVASDVALTGEITLQGVVLPVGGIKDKVLAAHQAGLQRVIIPNKSKKDLVNISQPILSSLEVVLVSHMDEVLLAAFNAELVPKCGQSSLSSKL